MHDVDEFNAAVDAAVEALAPRVGAQRQGPKGAQEKAVLTEAMRYFARGAGRDLGAFIDLLARLPEHVSAQTRATLIAADLADRLRAVRATDPLFGGTGEPADPGLLLTPPPGKRARVSVISMVGMASLEQWQGFVNQLQMALFSWIKRNPAEEEPLKALLVMDEAQDLVEGGWCVGRSAHVADNGLLGDAVGPADPDRLQFSGVDEPVGGHLGDPHHGGDFVDRQELHVAPGGARHGTAFP